MKYEYYSQDGQDEYLDRKIFKGKTGGVFLDIGASDGITGSNTYFFEKYRLWTGICVEPRKPAFEDLVKNRNCVCECCCISDFEGTAEFVEIKGRSSVLSGLTSKYDPRHRQRVENEIKQYNQVKRIVEVNCMLPRELLKKHNIDKVDFCSIDVEGSELDIIKAIDFKSVSIDVLAVENNFDDLKIKLFLAKEGYKRIKTLGADEIYKKVESCRDQVYLRILTLRVIYPFLVIGTVFKHIMKGFVKGMLVHLGLFKLVKTLYKKYRF